MKIFDIIKSKSSAKTRIVCLTLTAFILLMLAGLPQSPFAVIKGIKKKSSDQTELVLPISKLSGQLSVSACTESYLETVYDNNENFNPAKSGLNVFKSRLSKEYKSKSFADLALQVLASSTSTKSSKTCILPMKVSADSKLATNIPNSDLLDVSLGAESIFCSKGKAYLSDKSDFYAVSKVIESYSKLISDKKAVLTLKKQLANLQLKKSKLGATKKTQKAKLEKDIRKLSLSVAYAQYFSKDSDMLASFFDSICSQAAAIATPNSRPNAITSTAAPTSVPTTLASATPKVTATIAPTAAKTATRIATTIPVENRIQAPDLLSPAEANDPESIFSLPPNSTQVTISWSKVEYKPGFSKYLIRATDVDSNLSILTNSHGNPESYTSESITFSNLEANRTYHFWLHSAKEVVDYSPDSPTYSTKVDFYFKVSNSINPTTIPTVTPTTNGTVPSSTYKIGDRIELINLTNIRTTAGLNATLLGQQQIGAKGIITAGPLSADGYTWWNVNFDSGSDGFCGENNYKKIEPECTNGQTQQKTFWLASSVPANQVCQSQSQTWTCTNGEWKRTTGTYEASSCYAEGAPGQTFCVNKSNSACFSSITACVNQSAPGDICEVAAGNYPEKIKATVSGQALRPIIIKAAAGANVTANGLDLDSAYFIQVEGIKFLSLTRDVITWRFNTHYLAGTYVNGDPWVKGPVTLASFDAMPAEDLPFTITRPCVEAGNRVKVPAFNPGSYLPGFYKCAYVGEWKTGYYASKYPAGVNPENVEIIPLAVPVMTSDLGGSMLDMNPKEGAAQGLSLYGALNDPSAAQYDASKNIAKQLPNGAYTINVSSNNLVQSLLSTASPGPLPKSKFSHASVLTVVYNTPDRNTFRPYYGGPSKPNLNVSFNNPNWDLLKKVETVSSSPGYENLIKQLKLLIIDKFGGYSAEPGTQFKSYSNSYMAYGREISQITSQAALYLQTNASKEDKAKVLIYLLQYGLDVYGAAVNGMQWFGNGGHNHGRFMPFYMAVRMLNLGDQKLNTYANQFQEMNQHFYVNSLPEWKSNRDDPNVYLAWNATGYRFINGGPNSAAILSMLLMEGSRANIKNRFSNHPKVNALVDYIFDVFYPIETGNPKTAIRKEVPTYGVANNNNSIQPFTQDMWIKYAGNP